MTNQVVMDVVVSQHDVQAACQTLLNKSYELWLRFEVRTDDITAIVMELSDIPAIPKPEGSGGGASGPAPSAQTNSAPAEFAPKMITRARSFMGSLGRERKSTFFTPIPPMSDGETIEDIVVTVDDVVEKSESEKESISNSLKIAGLFSSNARCNEHSVIDLLKNRAVTAGEVIIEPGQDAARFYVIGEGTFEVLLHSESGGKSEVVHVYENSGCFGDVSLM
jgi:cGMP-dependent protein kinase